MIASRQFHPLIEKFSDKAVRNQAAVGLIGAINANDLRKVVLTDEARDALIHGLQHPNAKVRWWCLQYMDHLADESFIAHIIPMTKDPVGKVRRHAVHALTCDICKQDQCALEYDLRPLLSEIALNDPDVRVRNEAQGALNQMSAN